LYAENVAAEITIGLAQYGNTNVNHVKPEQHYAVGLSCKPVNYPSGIGL